MEEVNTTKSTTQKRLSTMTELLLQSSTAASKSQKVADEAAQIRQACQTDHGEKPLVQCPECFEKVLEVVRSRYLNSPDNEWFKSRAGFLQEIDAMFAQVKEYQLDPAAIDRRIQEERIAWYAENVRASLLRLMVEDPAGREAVFEKLEEPPSDITQLAKEITAIFSSKGGLQSELNLTDVPDRLASAADEEARLKVLKEAFFTPNGDSNGSEQYEKYFGMLKEHRLSMEQVVERILDDRHAAVGAREQSDKLKSKLNELRRARARHELEKRKKAKNQASSEEKAVPDWMYQLPPCAVCGETPSTADFICCPVCALYVGREIQEQQTVYCTPECRDKGYQSHMEESHTCSAKDQCIQLKEDEDPIMDYDGDVSRPHFCSECLTSLKHPTLWCSLTCADNNFQDHREKIHLPQRKKLKLEVSDEDQLVYAAPVPGGAVGERETLPPKYRAKDITSHVRRLEVELAEFQEQTTVGL
ncbi:hypothetical protein V8F20_000817 [Naviculisporaceae sp. PSN 640]